MLRDYRNLFLAESDAEFLRMLCVDMYTDARKQNPPAQKTLFPHAHPRVAKPQALGNALIPTSMSFDLDALFLERLELFAEPQPTESRRVNSGGKETPQICEKINHAVEEAMEKGVVDNNLRDSIQTLIHERDNWKEQAESQSEVIQKLHHRIYSKNIANSDLPADLVRRMDRVESENVRLRADNMQLKENLRAAESENATLCDENDGKNKKLKGANKKVKNAKNVAGKEEVKAKDAVLDKQRHLTSERKMKKERNDALAALEEQRKINESLRTELEVEKSGVPHMRDNETKPDITTVIVPVQFEVHRSHFRELLMGLEAYQMAFVDKMKCWYEEWKKPEEETPKVVGANYLDDGKKARIYEDMVEMPEGYLQTGAEHDGWRSKRGLEAVCRYAETRHSHQG
ncbi:Trafficking protein particle complex subunit 31 [Neocucurbitaria cava]|uniref:Trafficking protein particle complex subunit 31 n=1 Tax=Neocucurbitaria cava TaxID=798079 RepID=A0A9W9CHG8_9PLEO|nr:Trafficking protein particle complex subunit 31 [Neocucurbitaria cava]